MRYADGNLRFRDAESLGQFLVGCSFGAAQRSFLKRA
jgi:hypothetical protein